MHTMEKDGTCLLIVRAIEPLIIRIWYFICTCFTPDYTIYLKAIPEAKNTVAKGLKVPLNSLVPFMVTVSLCTQENVSTVNSV